MPIKSDSHLHSAFSGDSDTPMEEMIGRGMALGLDTLTFTEHMDIDYPISEGTPEGFFLLDTKSYLQSAVRLREEYRGRIDIRIGVELGLHPQHIGDNSAFLQAHRPDFDLVIASTHIAYGRDPYLPAFFADRSVREAYREFFEASLENVRSFDDFDVYGHLDYVLRYGGGMRENLDEWCGDVIEEILTVLVNKNKGLEINTSALRNNLKEPHPCSQILRRYRELGGETILVGSDAHKCGDMAQGFDLAAAILRDCGFRYHAVFCERKARYIKLENP